MSVTNWALSGNPLEEAVVSIKTGHVFEKKIIEKYIDNTGQCPITGINLERKDLLPLKGKILRTKIHFLSKILLKLEC